MVFSRFDTDSPVFIDYVTIQSTSTATGDRYWAGMSLPNFESMVWNYLPSELQEICRNWRENLFSDADWKPAPDQPKRGEASGMKVTSDEVPFGAYMKPGLKKHDSTPRAANEKICADLGQDAEVQVPPALLYERQSAGKNDEKHTALSLFLSDQVWTLQDFLNIKDPPWDLIDPLLDESSGIIAFDAWVGNSDRAKPENILLIETSNGIRKAVFIDFAFALNNQGSWEDSSWKSASLPDFPDRIEEDANSDEVLAAVERIESLSEEDIREVVERIPDPYLHSEQRELIADALVERRSDVRSAVQPLIN